MKVQDDPTATLLKLLGASEAPRAGPQPAQAQTPEEELLALLGAPGRRGGATTDLEALRAQDGPRRTVRLGPKPSDMAAAAGGDVQGGRSMGWSAVHPQSTRGIEHDAGRLGRMALNTAADMAGLTAATVADLATPVPPQKHPPAGFRGLPRRSRPEAERNALARERREDMEAISGAPARWLESVGLGVTEEERAKEGVLGKLTEAVASGLTFLSAGLMTGGSPVAVGALGFASSFSGGYMDIARDLSEKVERGEMSEEEAMGRAAMGAWVNGGAGLSEMFGAGRLPTSLVRSLRGGGKGQAFRAIGKIVATHGLRGGGEEAGQEGFQAITQIVANELLAKDDADVFKRLAHDYPLVLESAALGGAVGLAFGGVGGLVEGVVARKRSAPAREKAAKREAEAPARAPVAEYGVVESEDGGAWHITEKGRVLPAEYASREAAKAHATFLGGRVRVAEDRDRLIARHQEAEIELRRERHKGEGEPAPVTLEEFHPDPESWQERLRARMAGAGVEVVFVRDENGTPLERTASIRGDQVVVDASSTREAAMDAVLDHELFHAMELREPESAAEFESAVRALDPDGYAYWLRRARELPEVRRATGKARSAIAREEATAMYVQHELRGWLRALRANPNMAADIEAHRGFFTRLVDALKRALRRVGVVLETSTEKRLEALHALMGGPRRLGVNDAMALASSLNEAYQALEGHAVSLEAAPKAERAVEEFPAPQPQRAVEGVPGSEPGAEVLAGGRRPRTQPGLARPGPFGQITTPEAPYNREALLRRARDVRVEAQAVEKVGVRTEGEANQVRRLLSSAAKRERAARTVPGPARPEVTRRPEPTRAETAIEAYEAGEEERFATRPEPRFVEALRDRDKIRKARTRLRQLRDTGKRPDAIEEQRALVERMESGFASSYPDWETLRSAESDRVNVASDAEKEREDRQDRLLAEGRAAARGMRPRVFSLLRAIGLKREYSDGASAYYAGTSEAGRTVRVRVSNHRVPMTAEREHNREQGGFTWASGSGFEIVLDGSMDEREVLQELDEVRAAIEGPTRFATRTHAEDLAPGTVDALAEYWFDEMHLGEKLVKRLDVPEHLNFVMRWRLRRGRVRHEMEQRVREAYLNPIVDTANDAGIEMGEIDEYLEARDAPDRNAFVTQAFPEEDWDPHTNPPSGLSDTDAAALVAKHERGERGPAFKKIARIHDKAMRAKLDYLVEKGVIAAEDRDTLNEAYPHYVPHKDALSSVERELFPRIGRGVSLTGKEFKRAMGRKSRSGNQLAYAVGDYASAVMRGEKATVGRTLYRMVERNAEALEGVVKAIGEVPKVRQVVKLRGGKSVVREVSDPKFLRLHDTIVGVKIGGRQHYVEFSDEWSGLASALNNAGAREMNVVMRTMRRINSVRAGLITRWNPFFGPFNFLRDVPTAVLTGAIEHGHGFGLRVLQSTPGGFSALIRSQGGEHRGGARWDELLERYKAAGAPISVFDLKTYEGVAREIEQLLSKGKLPPYQRVFDLVGNLNDAIENTTRLAAFRVAVERLGMSDSEAALYAKDITVNFERHGRVSSWLPSWYMFANVGLQGMNRVYRAAKANPKRFARIMSEVTAAGFLWGIVGRMLGGDDDDGELFYEKQPQWVKDSTIHMSVPGSTATFMLPLPYMFNVPWVMGDQMAGIVMDAFSPSHATAAVLSAIADSMNPVGGSELFSGGRTFLAGVAPSAVQPVAHAVVNRTWAGKSVYREPFPGQLKARAWTSWPDANPTIVRFARALQDVTGGDKYEAGSGIDLAPEALEYLLREYLGGIGKEAINVATTAEKLATGKDVSTRTIPLMRRFYREGGGYWDAAQFSEHMAEIRRLRASVKDYRAASEPALRERATRLEAENRGVLGLYARARSVDKRIKALRKEADKLEGQARIDKDEEIRRIALEFNTAYKKAQK